MKADYPINSLSIENDKTTLTREPRLDVASVNFTSCELQGVGPRYGMSPIPGQGHSEAGINLLTSEGTTAGYSERQRIFAFHTQKLERQGIAVPMPILSCMSQRSETTGVPPNTVTRTWHTLDAVMVGDGDGPDSDIAAGLLDPSLGTLDNGLRNWRLRSIEARTMYDSHWLRTAQLSVGLADYTCPYQLCDPIAGETATNCGSLAFNAHGYDYAMSKRTSKNLKVSHIFTDTGAKYFGRAFIFDNNEEPWETPVNEADSTAHFAPEDSNRQEQRITGPAYTSAELSLQYASDWVCSQSHAVIAYALRSKALLAILREERDSDKQPVQYCDPSVNRLQSTRTLAEGGAASYKERGVEVATGWAFAPDYDGTTALAAESSAAYDGQAHIRLGAADSGLLRSGLEYELGYALFDVTMGTETNVCTPMRFRTGSDDFVAISLFRCKKSGADNLQVCGVSLDVPVQKVPEEKVNYYQYRFYYRAYGSQEWLPAGHYWAADYLYNGQNEVLWGANAALGLSIGGAPGQYNDYSSLPSDQWKDVAVFQNRFFWCSDKQAIFSMRNNALAYPLRNAISLPSGEFRGLTVHVFYGQSEQTGRVVFWASDAQYEGRFTGQPVPYPVSVSPNFIAQFPLDGSDFTVQFRSSITSFSSRSAVVAEGALFFWGESGMYADSGVQPPNKISGPLEPWLGDVYDSTRQEEIFCIYSDRTKEIIWFYRPRTFAGFLTEAIVFNAEKQTFERHGFATQLDWAQTINLSQEGSRKRLSCGKRTVIGHSFALYPQRACFFDEKNNTGDYKHGREFFVKEIQSLPSGSRLVLASGFDVPAFADIAVSDSFLVSQSFNYTESESSYDGRYTITDIGSYYFDVDETLEPISLSNDKLMPIWVDNFSNIPFKIRTRYMMPGDFWQCFMISYLAMSFRLPKSILQDMTVGLFSNLNAVSTTQNVTMEANATSHCIRQLSFPHDDDKTHGIGFGLELTGNANGASWRLDWFGIEAEKGENLTRFEQ